jgi:hypothetical protein
MDARPGGVSPALETLPDADLKVILSLSYPDPGKDRKGFNPIVYPDLKFSYHVNVSAMGGGETNYMFLVLAADAARAGR